MPRLKKWPHWGRSPFRRGALCGPPWEGRLHAETHLARPGGTGPSEGMGQPWRRPKGPTSWWNPTPLAGVRSPPLRNGVGQREMALRGKAGDGANGVFSEGRTLCARKYGADASRGMWLSSMGGPEAGGPKEATFGLAWCLHSRACGARPFRGQATQ